MWAELSSLARSATPLLGITGRVGLRAMWDPQQPPLPSPPLPSPPLLSRGAQVLLSLNLPLSLPLPRHNFRMLPLLEPPDMPPRIRRDLRSFFFFFFSIHSLRLLSPQLCLQLSSSISFPLMFTDCLRQFDSQNTTAQPLLQIINSTTSLRIKHSKKK